VIKVSIPALVRKYLSLQEDRPTAALIERLKRATQRGHLTKGELHLVCRWKSVRAQPLVLSNNHHQIREATSIALSSREERKRLAALTSLRGVGIPMASAILMLLEPDRYAVIDIRVWQLLRTRNAVKGNPAGTNFTFKQWAAYLRVVRRLAKEIRVSVRDVERTLFKIHQREQVGTLYKPTSKTLNRSKW
jgi:thermostable 8-oxoguanine DNA glycosylase